MKLLLRLLWLLVGLIYRLIVLALFEHWIPFSERPAAEPQAPRAGRKQRGSARERAPVRRTPERRPPPGVGSRPRPPIFEPRSVEPAPERVAALESEHLAPRARGAGKLAPEPSPDTSRRAPPLRALLRDKRALASALILGEAFERRRPGPR